MAAPDRDEGVNVASPIPDELEGSSNILLPVLPLREICLFPEASLAAIISRPAGLHSLDIAQRAGRRILAVAHRDASAASPNPRDLHEFGTVADIVDDRSFPDGNHQVELDGHQRGRVVSLIGIDTLVAEVELLTEDDPADEWGPAVEALARYLHAHAELRRFLDQQRRSKEPMAWVNLACQHLPITATARQKLLEANARERCVKISRGLDALLRKEQSA
jgi:ATP-dependent Lon protease